MARSRRAQLLVVAILAAVCSAPVAWGSKCMSCPLDEAPVCGEDGLTYQHKCLAECQGVAVARLGDCDAPSAAGAMAAGASVPGQTAGGGHASTSGSATWDEISALHDQDFRFVGRQILIEYKGFKPRAQATAADSNDVGRPSSRAGRHTAIIYSADGKTANVYEKVTESKPGPAKSVESKPHTPRSSRRLMSEAINSLNITERKLFTDYREEVRRDVYPYTATAYLSFNKGGKGYHCTAALIAPSVAITAGHCVYDGGWTKNRVIYPGRRNGNYNPYGSVNVYKAVTFTSWTKDGSRAFDMAVLYLSKPIGHNTGYLGVGYTCGSRKYEFTSASYPGDKPTGTMWAVGCYGTYDMCKSSVISHGCTSEPGSSGAGLWENSNRRVRAIHTAGVGGPLDTPDYATTVRPETWSVIKEALDTAPR